MTLREREMLRRREEIISVAHELFVAQGFERVIVAEVARQVEFSRKTLYSHFKSKTDLMVVVVIRILYRLDKALMESLDSYGTWHQRFMTYGMLYLRFFQSNPGSFELINYFDVAVHNNPHKLSDDVLAELRRYRETTSPIVPRLLQGGIHAEEFREDLPIQLARDFFCKAISGVAHEYIIHPGGNENNYREELRMLLRAFTRPKS
ncbi:MAG: TetR/AcrR family transcriptional regulator; helix-turn-helix transcriptional regulator [Candidatus Cloacimonetes bacterium]|nr:TetR/AcrR family transcriptional regulator; helix-turn-helix transcriptional regulator [Candidatus Cloacimonadota bacterium]